MTSRSYCFTLNNYTDNDIELLRNFKCRYCIFGYEIAPTTNTPHLQGYIEFSSPVRMASIKKTFNTMHLEARKGTRDQARNYCMEDGKFEEIGTWTSGGQGKRNDLREVVSMIKDNTPLIEIMEDKPEIVSKNMRFVEKYMQLHQKDNSRDFRNVDVIIFWGDAGCGKTRLAHEMYPNIFTVNCDENFPFDGYEGETEVLLDDFYGNIKYHILLRILDGHQYRVEVKGGHRYAKWETVVITSNKKPEEWYQQGMTDALKRRITFCEHVVTRYEVPGNTEPAHVVSEDELF